MMKSVIVVSKNLGKLKVAGNAVNTLDTSMIQTTAATV